LVVFERNPRQFVRKFMIKLFISRLEKQPDHLVGEEPAELLGIENSDNLTIDSPLRYDLDAKIVSGEILVSGKIAVDISGLCGRCLVPCKETVGNDQIYLLFEIGREDEIDITEDIRTEMLLELPMNLVCAEDCAGLCPVCGANRNQKKCKCREDNPPASDCWSALDDLKL